MLSSLSSLFIYSRVYLFAGSPDGHPTSIRWSLRTGLNKKHNPRDSWRERLAPWVVEPLVREGVGDKNEKDPDVSGSSESSSISAARSLGLLVLAACVHCVLIEYRRVRDSKGRRITRGVGEERLAPDQVKESV